MQYTKLEIILAWLKGAHIPASSLPVSPDTSGPSIDCLSAQRTMFDSPENKFKIAIGKAQEKYGSPGPNPHRIPGHI